MATWSKVKDLTVRVSNSHTQRLVCSDGDNLYIKNHTDQSIYKYDSLTNTESEWLSDAEVLALGTSLSGIQHLTWFDGALYFVAIGGSANGKVFKSTTAHTVVEDFDIDDHLASIGGGTSTASSLTHLFLCSDGSKLIYYIGGMTPAGPDSDDYRYGMTAYKSGSTWTPVENIGSYEFSKAGGGLTSLEVNFDNEAFSETGIHLVIDIQDHISGTPTYSDDAPLLITWNGTSFSATDTNFALTVGSGTEDWMTGPEVHWLEAPTTSSAGAATTGTWTTNFTAENTPGTAVYRSHQINMPWSMGFILQVDPSVEWQYWRFDESNWVLWDNDATTPPHTQSSSYVSIVWRNSIDEVFIVIAPSLNALSDVYKSDELIESGGWGGGGEPGSDEVELIRLDSDSARLYMTALSIPLGGSDPEWTLFTHELSASTIDVGTAYFGTSPWEDLDDRSRWFAPRVKPGVDDTLYLYGRDGGGTQLRYGTLSGTGSFADVGAGTAAWATTKVAVACMPDPLTPSDVIVCFNDDDVYRTLVGTASWVKQSDASSGMRTAARRPTAGAELLAAGTASGTAFYSQDYGVNFTDASQAIGTINWLEPIL